MSYYCEISFKQISGDDVYTFLQSFKKEAIAHLGEIAEENKYYSPIMKAQMCNSDEFIISQELRDATREWAVNSVFRYRYFYNKELQLLGIYGPPSCLKHLFDKSLEFQNSCDQNYEFEYWDGVKYFEDVANKWKAASVEEICAWYKAEFGDDLNVANCSDFDYYRRWAAYREIWSNFERTLEDDDSALYLSLFGYYDIMNTTCFYASVENAVRETVAKWVED